MNKKELFVKVFYNLQQCRQIHTIFPTEVDLENEYDHYSACSNPTSAKSYAALLAGGLIG
jgi:hypothetical protein